MKSYQTDSLYRDYYTQKGQMHYSLHLRFGNIDMGLSQTKKKKKVKIIMIKILKWTIGKCSFSNFDVGRVVRKI